LVAGITTKITEEICRNFQRYFHNKNLRNVNHYLGIQIEHKANELFLLSQKEKLTKILEEYGLLKPRPAITPIETGFLLWIKG